LAEIERRERGDDKAAALWLVKLPGALPDPRWLCRACGKAEDKWQALCPACGAFDPFVWAAPGESRADEVRFLVAQTPAFET
jgi:HemY protein